MFKHPLLNTIFQIASNHSAKICGKNKNMHRKLDLRTHAYIVYFPRGDLKNCIRENEIITLAINNQESSR